MPNHRCDETTIDYSRVADGYLVCLRCGREWTLSPSTGWTMVPQERAPARP